MALSAGRSFRGLPTGPGCLRPLFTLIRERCCCRRLDEKCSVGTDSQLHADCSRVTISPLLPDGRDATLPSARFDVASADTTNGKDDICSSANDGTENCRRCGSKSSADNTSPAVVVTTEDIAVSCGNSYEASTSTIAETAGGDIPKYGVETDDDSSLERHMSDLTKWGVDVFAVAEATHQRPLTAIVYTILQGRNLLQKLRIVPHTLLSYLGQLEAHYHSDIPYHNSLHAADVTQTIHALLSVKSLTDVFTDTELFAAILAGAVHDVDHPGFTSSFLAKNSSTEMARLHSEGPLLESHHLFVAFSLLQLPGCDVLASFTEDQRNEVLRIVSDMVLATDMGVHQHQIKFLSSTLRSRKQRGDVSEPSDDVNRNVSTVIESSVDLESSPLPPLSSDDKMQILQCIIHCADLSNPTKPFDLYQQWTERIMEEFYRQGDQERHLGYSVTPMCNRHGASVSETQSSFIDNMCMPLWKAWCDFVYPDCQHVIESLASNRQWHSQPEDMSTAISSE